MGREGPKPAPADSSGPLPPHGGGSSGGGGSPGAPGERGGLSAASRRSPPAAVREPRAAPPAHLHARVVLEEEEHHALVDGVEAVVHLPVEAGGEDGGEQAPGAPGQHVGGRRAHHDGGGQEVAHGVCVQHQRQQHLPARSRPHRDTHMGNALRHGPPGPPAPSPPRWAEQSRRAGGGGGGSAVAAAPSREARSGHRLTAPLTPPPPPYCPAGGGAAPAGRRPLVACGELPGRPAGRGVALTGWSHSLYRGCVRWLRQPRPEGAVLEACPAVQRGARLASCKERSFKCSMV